MAKSKEERQAQKRACWKAWYAKNKKKYNAYHAAITARRRKEIREWLWSLKCNQKCKLCPETHPATLQYHHRNAKEKDGAIANLAIYSNRSRARILEEIAKCDLICANCHFKLHYNEREAQV